MLKVKKFARMMFAAAAAASFISVTDGQARDYPEYVKTACKKDFKTFCPRYDINSTAIRQCMRSVADQLSPRCVEALERSGERRSR